MSTRDAIEELLTALHGLDTSTPEAFASSFASAIDTLPRTAGVETEDTALSGKLLEMNDRIGELEDPSADIKENAPDEFNDVEKHHIIGLDHFKTKLSDDAPTAGDIYRINASGLLEHLAKGSNQNILTIVSNLPEWRGLGTIFEWLTPTIVSTMLSKLTGSGNDKILVSGGGGAYAWVDRYSYLCPTGVVLPFAGNYNVVPDGWLFANGASLSTSTYAALFAVIGYYYGGSSSDFNIPNTRQKFWKGALANEARDNATSRGYALHGTTENNHNTHGETEVLTPEHPDLSPGHYVFSSDPDPLTHTDTDNEPPHWIGPGIIKT